MYSSATLQLLYKSLGVGPNWRSKNTMYNENPINSSLYNLRFYSMNLRHSIYLINTCTNLYVYNLKQQYNTQFSLNL